jgi:glucose/mannose-6-phosphate isomerase
MVNLDDRELYITTDKSGMRVQIHGLPGQCKSAWQKALSFNLPSDYSDIDKVVILGMGGSAIGADLLKALTSTLSRPLVVVNREYDLPAWVDSKTLVIAASYSGNTEETLLRRHWISDARSSLYPPEAKLPPLPPPKTYPFLL